MKELWESIWNAPASTVWIIIAAFVAGNIAVFWLGSRRVNNLRRRR